MIVRNSILFLLIGLFPNLVNAQSLVYLATPDQKGQGILRQGGVDCYIIAPFHLVQDYFGPVEFSSSGNTRGRAKLVNDLGSDVAILRLENSADAKCTEWEFDNNINKLAASVLEGYLETADLDGSITVNKVQIVRRDDQYLYVKPLDPGNIIAKGMSGSPLVISDGLEKIFLGFLLEVDDKGVGSVLRASQLERILNSFFTKEIGETVAIEVVGQSAERNSELAHRAIDVLSVKFPNNKFIAKGASALPKGVTQWIIRSSTEIDPENKIDAAIHKYKTKLNLEIIKDKSRIHKAFLGGAIDYDRDAAIRNSFDATVRSID